jgi:hypothetical protein
MTGVLKVVLLLLCLPALATAQTDRATLSGTVSDPSGAAVPKAKVTSPTSVRRQFRRGAAIRA